MLRAALLTADPALWSTVSATVVPRPGCLIDLRLLRDVLPRRGAALECDLLVVDLRHPDYDWVWALRAPASLPTLVIVPPSTASSSKMRLPMASRRDLTFMDAAAPSLLPKVRRFIRLHSAPPQWRAHFGNYILRTPERTVEIAGQGALRLSEHKFRFILGLFLHRRVRLHWSLLHRLAWGEEGELRPAAVGAHAAWAREVLEIDGRHGYDLVSGEAHHELRRRSNIVRSDSAKPPPSPPAPRRDSDFADSEPGVL
ncbi:Uncharacterised protein [Xylophilus ampelinus]|nr:hypothetical protein [Variovorax sp.]VTY36289.1 Uncharacterised protein [Xylophilus ampelinus]|tara:strand:+ start:177 stop:944 length:768 start_codon:yes stop_codon:yes gene_type:complete